MAVNKQRYDIMIGLEAGELIKGVKASKGSLESLEQTVKNTLDVLNTSPKQFGVADTKQLRAARKEAELYLKEIQKLQAAGKTSSTTGKGKQYLTPRQSAELNARAANVSQMISQARPSVIEANKAKEQQKALSQMQNKSITLRYALYDVGSAAQSAAQGLLAYSGAALNAAIAQEAAFSQIEKTLVGQVSTQQLEKLKQELVDLSTQIPVSFDELTKIGMLGSQLGILSDDVAKFTEVTAKFSAITGMSVEETAMGFGKIANILGLSSSQYETLGSAIAAVGVKTAATEQQIISTAGQIGAVAKAAGFSASQVIGLSAAFASLRIAPEEARGVVVRTFNEINNAVRTFSENSEIGGEKLRILADVAGVSSKEFAEAWSDKTAGGAGEIFSKFIKGLSESDIPKELARIGLDGVRTSKGLTALANGFDLVMESMDISRQAGQAGVFLDEAFATIVEDIASKLTMVKNSFDNLFAAAGGGALLDLVGNVLDIVIALNNGLTDLINNNPVVGSLVKFSVVITGLLGLLALLASTLAIAGGGFLALRTAYLAAAADGIIFQGSLMGSIAQMMGISVASKPASAGILGVGAASGAAAVGVNGLTTSMKLARLALASTGVGVVLLLFGELAAMLMKTGDAAEAPVTGLDEVQQSLKEVRDETNATTQELVDFINQALLPISNMVKTENALYSLGQSLRDGANDFSRYSKTGRANITSLMSTIEAFTVAAQGDQQLLANNLTALMNYMIGAGLGTARAFRIIQAAILETGKTAEDVLLPFASLEAGMNGVTESAGRAETALEKMTKAFEAAFETLDRRVDLESSLDAFGEALAENGKNIDTFSKGGRDNFKALRDVIFSLKDRLAGNPQSLANSLASLRKAMVQSGITSKTAFKMIDEAMDATGKKGRVLRKLVEGLFNTINQSAEDSKPIRTLTDYVSDLSSVLDSAFNNRYAKQDASDSISSAWTTIKEAAEDAKKAIDDANASINEMQADRNVLQYQLQVAIRYGDTLRAESIKAKLAKLDADLVEKRNDLADAQAEANKTLVGNTKYAIANRAVVRDLVEDYNNYLASLAQSGMSSDQLNTEAAKLADEFLAQGVELGFAKEELLKYTDAFKKDFTTVVNNLPRDITLNPVTEPALQAIVDFVKDANIELAKLLSGTVSVNVPGITTGLPRTSTGSGLGSGSGAGGSGSGTGAGGTANPSTSGQTAQEKTAAAATNRKAQYDAARSAVDNQLAAISKGEQYLAELRRDLAFAQPKNRPPIQQSIDRVNGILQSNRAKLKPLQQTLSAALQALQSAEAKVSKESTVRTFMRDGGLVRGPGSGTSDNVNAMLSNGEYVLRANAVKYYGADFMNSLNQMQVQRGGTAAGSNVVYLSPDDRALLRAAIDRPISLYTENTRIAESANSGNVVLAQRGMK